MATAEQAREQGRTHGEFGAEQGRDTAAGPRGYPEEPGGEPGLGTDAGRDARATILYVDARGPAGREALHDRQYAHQMLVWAAGGGTGSRAEAAVLFRTEEWAREGARLMVQSAGPLDWRVLPRGLLARAPEETDLGPLAAGLARGQRYSFVLEGRTIQRMPLGGDAPGGTRGGACGGRTRERERELCLSDDRDVRGWLDRVCLRHGLAADADEAGLPLVRPVPTGGRVLHEGRKGGLAVLHGHRFEGILTIADPRLAREALLLGLGRGRAYGYGLLTLTWRMG